MLKKYFITTPIFYVNAKPHLGHVYSVLLADAQNRFQKLRRNSSKESFFTTGTDEHGLKIQQAAEKQQKTPKDFCDQVSSEFQSTFQNFNVHNDDFIRTTDERHIKTVQEFWKNINGFLQKKSYSSWYCVQDETFLTEHQIDKSKMVSLESGHPVEWAEEENYVFPLEKFRPQVQKWVENSVYPVKFRSNLSGLLSETLPDLSVSRSSSRLQWGIPVPEDPSQTIYVWLDALINYLTVVGYPNMKIWPPDCHVIGKDILKFHAIYWPSFLLAANLELPRKILCHSHWTVNEEKMSKSKGNVVDPNSVAEEFATHEGLRYFLLRQGVPHSDGNYVQDQLVNYINNDLANILGNLLNRLTSKGVNLNQNFYPICTEFKSQEAEDLVKSLENLVDKVEIHFENFEFYRGIEEIMDTLRKVNFYVQAEEPWELKKLQKYEELGQVLNLSLNALRICGILLQPIIPGLSDKLLTKLNVEERSFHNAKLLSQYNELHDLNPDKVTLFKKI